MYPFGRKPLDQLTGQDILEVEEEENLFLDYKVDLPRKEPGSYKQELRKDITSFANAEGGVLIIGVAEKNKKPTSHRPGTEYFVNKTSEQIEKELYNALSVDVTPPMPNIEVRAVQVPSDPSRHFCIVAVHGRSWRAPHFFRCQRADPHLFFYIRTGSDNKPMEYSQIMESFRDKEKKEAEVRDFRENCLKSFDRGWTPFGTLSNAFVLHVFARPLERGSRALDLYPFSHFGEDLGQIGFRNWTSRFSLTFDFDGMVADFRSSHEEPPHGFIRIYREGVLELVDLSLIRGKVNPTEICQQLFASIHAGWDLLASLGLHPPFDVGFTLWNVDVKFRAMEAFANSRAHVYPMITVEDKGEIAANIKYLLGHVMQTFGEAPKFYGRLETPRELSFSWTPYYSDSSPSSEAGKGN